MGKIIVKNIKGMSWKARISLIAMFTLVFSVLFYQGWNQLRNAHAAIGMSSWVTLYNNATTYPNSASVSYTPTTGSKRLLVVTVSSASSSNSAHTYTISFGGQTLTKANGDNTTTTVRQHSAIYYLNESGIAAALGANQSANFSLTVSGGTANGTIIYATTLTNVDQAAPISASQIRTPSTTTTSATSFASSLTTAVNDKSIAIVNAFRTGSSTSRTLTPATNWTQPTSGQPGNLTVASGSSYVMRAIAVGRAIPTSAATDANVGTLSSTCLVAVTGISVKAAATTTLGNGVAGTTANVAPGATNQKLDGFSLVNDSGTNGVTGLTVTTTNQAAIASMSIWNEAGTTQYFTTVNNPGTDTWTFSGGTSIPVTTTAANYKIYVTYKARALAPTGNTATTARVSALTTANATTGTDTADTTLTLLNTHAASTWGTCTPGNAQVVLNWTKGTSTQSAIIIRYTGVKTDTTKPTDGTTYTVGTSFGTGGTVVYNGAATTYTNTLLSNGTTYYYKIFEYDSLNYYYNATDVWTAALVPVSPDAVPPTVDPGFTATTPVNVLAVPITSFGATDNVGGSGVSGYLITTSTAQPSAAAAGWTSTPPATYTVAAAGSYTLYPWAKDAGGNVSPLYSDPVPVVVDLTKPTVTAFTVPTQAASRSIPVSSFTASDTGASGMAGYMITTSNTPPAFDNAGWLASPPATFTVATDGSFTLYPWAKDAANNVSVAFGTPRTVLVDTTAPTGLTLLSPADEATALPQSTTLTCSTASDGTGSGGVMYQFQITSDNPAYSQNSGWIAGTSYAPPALVKGAQYVWTAKVKDALGNESGWLTSRTFTITAPCVRNDPTLILLTPGGAVASTITTDSGTSIYNLRVINNDTGDCGSTAFNLTAIDTDLYDVFDNSIFDNGLTSKTVTLQPNSETTTTVTARATAGNDSGVEKTIVTSAADANHAAVQTSFVQTTLNVVTCQPKTPLLIVGPDSGYLNKGGKMVYTITIKNTDTGAGCAPVQYNLSKTSESNSTDFNASTFSVPSITLGAGELGSATLTVSAKSTATKNAVNNTVIHLAATSHASPADVTVRSTVNNPMLHNSDNTGSPKWTVSGGWGVPNGRYGEIRCETCHLGGGGDTRNVKRINEKVFTPYTTGGLPHFPGEGKTIAYRRYVGTKATDPVLGWDFGATPRTNPNPTKICEACHTYDATGANGVKAHPYSTTATLGNHFNTDGKDCTKCHKHNKGFGASNMLCNSCHGDTAATEITAANRYVVAPPKNTNEVTGTLTGTGQVSNDPKVGAHQTHLRFTNGFSNYSTVDFRCQGCHGPVPTNFVHANGSSAPVFEGLANNRNARTPSFSNVNLTCNNTYCHNPAGTGGSLATANAGFAIQPSWTSASYLTDTTRKSQTNCSRCHKVPGDAGFSYQSAHGAGMVTNESTDCSGCHGHNGDTSGTAGKRHIDGIRYAAGNCNSCHDYDTVGATYAGGKWTGGSWGKAGTNYGAYPAVAEGWGAHAKHINYIKTRLGISVALAPENQTYGAGAPANVCGACHTNIGANHNMGGSTGDAAGRMINFGDSVFKIGGTGGTSFIFGSNPLYNGVSGTTSGTTGKTCSNISCHYFITPLWSTY